MTNSTGNKETSSNPNQKQSDKNAVERWVGEGNVQTSDPKANYGDDVENTEDSEGSREDKGSLNEKAPRKPKVVHKGPNIIERKKTPGHLMTTNQEVYEGSYYDQWDGEGYDYLDRETSCFKPRTSYEVTQRKINRQLNLLNDFPGDYEEDRRQRGLY